MESDTILGVDIGGSGMKAALVDIATGQKLTPRYRIETPQPAEPNAMQAVFGQLVEHFDWSGAVGCTFPGVVRNRRIIETAANLDDRWVGVDAAELFGAHSAGPVTMLNDADAAGIAEMRLGAGRDATGVVVLITVGTGLGTAVFNDGLLLPNSELGHIEIDGIDAEELATSRIREELDLSLSEWANRFSTYLQRLENLLWPDLFIIGGGISKEFDTYAAEIQARTPVRAAETRNHAGIIGAALAASATQDPSDP